ncbi:RNA methyltransferase [Aureimonas flava]|uniref:RNA methyltransferase n=1 Tax=Aureimonas flava TaxID=2320271 RepID=A0A3A1WFM2_9HYPH|nr:RNA methyltransferase [Aureimonas flava]RIX98726.1 RNA methyltransferase [Aureimonas flava]
MRGHEGADFGPAVIDIADREDERIAAFRDVRERDLTRSGRFIAEGAVVLDQILASRRFRLVALLVLRERLAGLAPRLAALPADTPVYRVERELFDRIAGFPVHRGVMALAEPVEPAAAADLDAALAATVAARGCVVVACGLSNHDNMGATFRNAAAFGAGAVILDRRACDPLYRKAIRVSVGTVFTVPFARWGGAVSIADRLAGLGFECVALSPGAPEPLRALRDRRARALFLGAEGEGLEGDVIARCRPVRIEMASGLDSLNVATSAALVLHHLAWPEQP